MTSLRLPALAAVLLATSILAAPAAAQAPVEWYINTGGGGTLAQPVEQTPGGGIQAPVGEGAVDEPLSDISAAPPVVSSSRVTPAPAEPQPERDVTASAAAEPPAAAPAQTTPDEPAATGAEPGGSLPFTGLQLGALAGAGLALLVAGLALRPRRAA